MGVFQNNLLAGAAAAASAGGAGFYDFQIENSCRFDNGSSSYLYRDNGSGTTNGLKWTISCWIKRTILSDASKGYFWGNSGGWNAGGFDADDNLNTAVHKVHQTTAEYRDTNAWMHIVWNIQGLNTSYLWVNGVAQTINVSSSGTFNTPFYPSTSFYVGRSGTNYFDGYLAEYHTLYNIDADQDDFGEFKNGVWVPKEYTGTYGNNGFFLEFNQTGTSQNSSGIGADTSGNDEHFAVTNLAAIDVTTDTPTNNFATMNPLDNYYAGQTFSEGNCKVVTGNSASTFNTSTIGVANGKWYWEVKIIDKATGSDQTSIGIQGGISPGATSQIGYNTRGQQLRSNGNTHTNGGNSTYMASLSDNDIVMVAFDRDNNSVYFGANGQWGDGSGNTDEANPTSAKGISVADDDFVFAALGDMTGSDTCTYEINFGNPPFSISSGNADANGHGNFEYAVPTGYFALCTKNLAENG